MTDRWLGVPWRQVREELNGRRIAYTLDQTVAPGRDPFGDDVRVVRIREDEGTLNITVCAFQTRVNG